MQEVICGLFILFFDAVLSLALWSALVILKCPGCGGLTGVWFFSAAKWFILYVFTSLLTDGKSHAQLRRLVALLCLLSPVFESGRILVISSSVPYKEPTPDLSMLLVGLVSSSLACLVWENGLCGNEKRTEQTSKLNARRVLLRVVQYFRPDSLHLFAAFSSLILGVVCKWEIISIFHAVVCRLYINIFWLNPGHFFFKQVIHLSHFLRGR